MIVFLLIYGFNKFIVAYFAYNFKHAKIMLDIPSMLDYYGDGLKI
jgi:hypothetical protein